MDQGHSPLTGTCEEHMRQGTGQSGEALTLGMEWGGRESAEFPAWL